MAIPVNLAPVDWTHRAEDIEVELLLDGLFQLYGFDFRGYERPVLRSRFSEFMRARELLTISALQDCVFHDQVAAEALLVSLAKRSMSLFENAAAFRSLREVMVPLLRSYPLPRIHHSTNSR
jgi:chemotaxis protein methyltransferase CheR